MNKYQKVLICIFRALGITLIAFSAMTLIPASLIMEGMLGMSLLSVFPYASLGFIFYFAASILAKIITIGIEE